jgi:hypothetical protein
VALNVDDGFEFFGGTVNAKYLSTLFVGDDAFDTDKGYQGKMQYLLAMIGTQGNHGTEMDGNKEGQTTFSAPQVQSMTVVGSNDNAQSSELLRLREGTGGAFANIVLAKGNGGNVVRHSACDDGGEDGVKVTQAPSSTGFAMLTEEYLYVAGTTVIQGSTTPFADTCATGQQLATAVTATAAVLTAVTDDVTESSTGAGSVDLTPVGDAVAAANVEAAYSPWFDTVDYSGAFAPGVDSWLDGWSYLDCVQNVLAGGSLDCTDPNALADLPFKNCDGTWQLPACPCPAGKYSAIADADCTDCASGSFSAAGAATCATWTTATEVACQHTSTGTDTGDADGTGYTWTTGSATADSTCVTPALCSMGADITPTALACPSTVVADTGKTCAASTCVASDFADAASPCCKAKPAPAPAATSGAATAVPLLGLGMFLFSLAWCAPP